MSEIEKIKLYQNAGIEPTYTDECIIANRYWDNEELANEYGTFDKFMEKNCKFGYQDCTDECEYAYTKTHYPPFTAEKQLELIKWLAETGDVCRIDTTVKNKWFVENEVGYSKCFEEFEEALANVINIIWEYMPAEEKQQVKEILK